MMLPRYRRIETSMPENPASATLALAYANGMKSCAASQARCGASTSAPMAIVTHGAAEQKYWRRRGSTIAASPSPAISEIDQYLPSMAAPAPSPANAANAMLRVSNERRNHQVVAAHSGMSTASTLNFRARKL